MTPPPPLNSDVDPSQYRSLIARAPTLAEAMRVKALFQRATARMLRDTPEYRQALRERRARAWLDQESYSMAELLYATTQERLEDLDP